MKFYWIKTHSIIKRIFSNYVWDLPNNEKKVYLTFDDGPTPEITNWVLLELEKYNAKATFFCIGKNIVQNQEIYKKIIDFGHSIGNHTFNHENGWKTNSGNYNNSIQNFIFDFKDNISKLFRPPYGKIKFSQARKLRRLGYKIIMWDVLSADFDVTISKEKCLDNVISNIESGSIVVFHDSEKAFKNLQYTLPKTLNFLKDNGYSCESIII
jgi:peptidoglycan-N-acetylglucosamine deacetylase